MAELRPPLKSLLREAPDHGAKQRAEIWKRIEARRDSAPRAHRLRPMIWVGTVVACALLVGYFVKSHETSSLPPTAAHVPAPQPSRVALSLAGGRPLEHLNAQSDSRIELSDGTFIELAAGAQLTPTHSTAEELELRVETGRVTFDVRPQQGRRFVVLARETRVLVVGTRFSVTVHDDTTSVDVSVEHGLVRVLAPTLQGGQTQVGAGQAVSVPSEAPNLQTSTVSEPPVTPAPPAAAATRSAAFEAAEHGDFKRAYKLLGDRGYAAAVADAKSVDQLLLLADTARLSQHPAQAASAFEVILSKHARDERASLAALSLGRIELDQRKRPKEAAAAFERALELGLPAGLLEDAHARRVQALAQAGLRERARAAADEYLKRFPQGRRRADVQRWVAAP